ncbi:hypothetical protein LGV61_11030 [Desulfurispirillum indicum]|uniref:hypothetical protein n=1 Tax=Desulfurispirillum indicum TaxID=936456 RepID=UPI001CF9D411|nr:hypothetical protein [Desulfurispirillum indicum]UCZ56249.1 hypothetical protein LGV61_11030 [Desulfurispirillum indicum]
MDKLLDIEFAENLLRAKSDATMPIVYVSAGNDNRLFVDVARVAKSLAGMAHVVVEPSRSFSFKLMRKVSGENAYGGAVGIYWPDGIGKSLFLPSRFTDGKEMQNAIIDKVRNSLLSQRTIRECTWFYLQELLARKKITELKESDSKNIEEYIYHFDTEIASKNEEIRRLEEEILKMRHVIQLKSDRIDRQDNDIVVRSTEQDFYQAERLDILIDVLQSAISGVEQNSRRWAILKDIVDGHQGSGERNSILDKLKRILSTYDSMTTVIRAELISLGFEISEDGKHYKLIYRGDPRYSFVLSKSGSDRRGGRNAFSDLKRRLF